MQGKNVLVVGLGVSGRSAARFLLDKGAHVMGFDQNLPSLRENGVLIEFEKRGMTFLEDKEGLSIPPCDLLVVSPGVPRENILYRQAVERGIEVIGEIELACRYLKNTLIGITGTNGKTTVALLVGHVLNHCGIPAKVLGNVGTPLTSILSECQEEVIVCELSSFQLETMESPVLDAGAILNISHDHLDRYSGIEEYAATKIQIKKCLKPGANLYVEWRAYEQYKELFQNYLPKIYGYSPICDLFVTDKNVLFYQENIEYLLPDRYRGRASHDVENIMAAFALCCELGGRKVSVNDFDQALHTFVKPPHRIEFVTTIKGVNFFNDSKGTNIDAVMRAVESMRGRVVLIAGGIDKGGSYAPWKKAFANKVKGICAIGQSKEKIREELSQNYSVHLCSTLELAVHKAFTIAKEGENVLLSPGCSSFDMFRHFEHRGDEFKRIVCKETSCYE